MDPPEEDKRASKLPEELVKRVEAQRENSIRYRAQVAESITHRPPSNALQRFNQLSFNQESSTSGSQNGNGYVIRVKKDATVQTVRENRICTTPTSQMRYDASRESRESIEERNLSSFEGGLQVVPVVNMNIDAEEVVDEINLNQIPLPPARYNQRIEVLQNQLMAIPDPSVLDEYLMNQWHAVACFIFALKMPVADYAAAVTLYYMATRKAFYNASVASIQTTEQSTQRIISTKNTPQIGYIQIQQTDTSSRTINVTESDDDEPLNNISDHRPLEIPMFSSINHRPNLVPPPPPPPSPAPPSPSPLYDRNLEENLLFPQYQQPYYPIPQRTRNLGIQNLIDNREQQAQIYSAQRQYEYDMSMATTSAALNLHELHYPFPRLQFERSQYQSPEYPHIENVSARTPLSMYPQSIRPPTSYQTLYEQTRPQATQSSTISHFRQTTYQQAAFRPSRYQQIDFGSPRLQPPGLHITTSQLTRPQHLSTYQRLGQLPYPTTTTGPRSHWPQQAWPPIKRNGQTWPQSADLLSTHSHRAPMKQRNIRKARKPATMIRSTRLQQTNTRQSHPQQTASQTTRRLPTWPQASTRLPQTSSQQDNLQPTDLRLIRFHREPEPRPERFNPHQYVNVQHQEEFPQVDDDPEPLDLTTHHRYHHPRN